jgi:selenide,water dikinase
MNNIPIVKDIVLIGGGHAHALVVKMWGMSPVPGLRITLISPQVNTPYSGMLPGLVAGHYSFDEIHIDLPRLCSWAGVRFIQAEVCGIDTRNQELQLASNESTPRPNIGYDSCSFDIGATPNKTIDGFEEFDTGVKPISRFYQHWRALQHTLLNNTRLNNTNASIKKDGDKPYKIAIIGGGAGGIELITAMQYWSKSNNCNAEFHLVNRAPKLLPNLSSHLQSILQKKLLDLGIHCHLNENTQSINRQAIETNSSSISYDKAFYCTQASAASWLKESSLNLHKDGFININNQLQAVGYDNVFAAGDIAHQVDHPRPKAGVYAVRMAPVLFHNLINQALKKTLQTYIPQKDFLSLLALGDKFALGSRPPFSISGQWVWHWKKRIDEKFMAMFEDLPDMLKNTQQSQKIDPHLQSLLGIKDIHELAMRCGGCGGKVGATVLSDVLNTLRPYNHPDVVMGLNAPDDAAVINIPNDKQLVQTVDHLKTFIDDPYQFGQLSVLHALSDAFAMNSKAQTAQALVQLPLSSEAIQRRDMKQLMQGALDVLNQHECALVGGHTSEDSQLGLGFCINALASPETLLCKQGAQQGQVLILTKPLGTGALFAAHMRAKASGNDIEFATNQMLQSNQQAANIFYQHQASACTDVTGFGLLGHLVEMLKHSTIGASINLQSLPVLPGVLTIMKSGIYSSLQPQNVRLRRAIYNHESAQSHPHYPIIFDPQTCGGLLACVDNDNVDQCINALHDAGYTHSTAIGEIIDSNDQGLIRLN